MLGPLDYDRIIWQELKTVFFIIAVPPALSPHWGPGTQPSSYACRAHHTLPVSQLPGKSRTHGAGKMVPKGQVHAGTLELPGGALNAIRNNLQIAPPQQYYV